MSIWDDVVFDSSSARAYAAELRAMAGRTEDLAAVVDAVAGEARRDWTGHSRVRFDADVEHLWRQALDAAGRLRAQADDVEAADGAARREQAVRVRARAAFHERVGAGT